MISPAPTWPAFALKTGQFSGTVLIQNDMLEPRARLSIFKII